MLTSSSLLTSLLVIALEYLVVGKCAENSGAINLKKYLQPYDVGRNETYDFLPDDGIRCARNCTLHPESRICYYEFVLEQYHQMGPACDGCPEDPKNCFNPQCVTGGGFEKTVLTINRMIPGPAIHVCHGDRIIVKVINKMPGRDVTIHWHGMLQRKTPYMDGVAHVSQCPILENEAFQYDFEADPCGSHFHHSHLGFQNIDGISGVLVVRSSTEVDHFAELYDYDLYSHTIHLKDFSVLLADDKYPGYNKDPTKITIDKCDGYLINGMGFYMDPITHQTTKTPLATFKVKSTKRYRFRIIGVTSYPCTLKFTVEKHSMLLIAVDGVTVKPVEVRTLTFASAESYDVIINANQKPDAYWIRVQGEGLCEPAVQFGILQYEESNSKVPTSQNTKELFNSLIPLPELNNVRMGCSDNADSVCMDELSSVFPPKKGILDSEPADRFFFHLSGYKFSKHELYETNHYYRHKLPFAGPSVPHGGIFTDVIDNKTSIFPSPPLLTTPYPPEMLCPKVCDKPLCICLNLVKVETGKMYEIVILDDLSVQFGAQMVHPVHFHGFQFWVLKQGSTKERFSSPDYYKFRVQNNTQPAVMDNIDIPPGGYAVIRFIADNIGMWPLHCHFAHHMHDGMFVIFQVGERTEFKPIPNNFPTCDDYLPPVMSK